MAQEKEPEKFPLAIIAALTIAGFFLRLICARGDLWLDEILSLQNLASIHRADEIFYAVSQDNNHFLNSLWLFIVGPQAPPQIIRLASIILGTLTIPVAAKLALRIGRAAALAAAALVAFGTIFVHYGSEARGYAGFLLMLFCAAEALERCLEDSTAAKPRAGFALAVGFGSLFHIAMIEAAAILVVATIARIAFRMQPAREIAVAGRNLAVAAFLGALPALACLLAGLLYTHKIQFGAQVPFSFAGLVQGLTALFGATIGFTLGSSVYLSEAVALVWIILGLMIIKPERRILPACTIFLPPLLAIAAQLPSVHIPRFHLIATLGLVLLFAECVGHFTRSRRPAFAIAMVFVALVSFAGQVTELFERGRGDYRGLIAEMEAQGAGAYASNMEAEVIRTLRFYDPGLGGRLTPANEADWCSKPPLWYILSDDPAGETPSRMFGPATCPTSFVLKDVMVPAALSGLRFALYRRAGS